MEPGTEDSIEGVAGDDAVRTERARPTGGPRWKRADGESAGVQPKRDKAFSSTAGHRPREMPRSPFVHTTVGVPADQAAASPSDPLSATSTSALNQTTAVEQQAVSTDPTQRGPSRTVRTLVFSLLAGGGSPLVTPDPLTPAGSPVGWALAAWTTRSRSGSQAESRQLTTSQTVVHESTTDDPMFFANAKAALASPASSAPPQPASAPEQVTGMVTVPTSTAAVPPVVTVLNTLSLSGWTTGKPQLISPDGSRVIITTYPPPLFGSTLATVIDTATGTQIGAVTVPGALVSSLLSTNGSRAVITASPLSGGAKTRVAVINPITGAQMGSTVVLTGGATGTLLSADGTRAVVTTYNAIFRTTRATVINTATGAKIGTTFSLSGDQYIGTPLLSIDGSRAVVTTRTFTRSGVTTRAAVINTSTGTRIGRTLTITGEPLVSPVLTADGTRALITTVPHGDDLDKNLTRVAVINMATGTQIGQTLALTGSSSESPILSADSARALITTTATDAAGTSTRTLSTVINTTTGTQVGTTLTLSGSGGSAIMNADGSRALITAYDATTDTTRAAVVNTNTGTQIGNLSVTGTLTSRMLSADHTRALITTYVSAPTNTTARMALIDFATGAQIGTTMAFTVTGNPDYPPSDSTVVLPLRADAGRVLITVRTYNPAIVDSITSVAVLDVASGSQSGSTLAVTGALSTHLDPAVNALTPDLFLTADGSRAVVATRSYAVETGKTTRRVAFIDTASGGQVGTTLAGEGIGSVQLNADRTRVLVDFSGYNPDTGTDGQWVMVIDPLTGAQVGALQPSIPDPSYQLVSRV